MTVAAAKRRKPKVTARELIAEHDHEPEATAGLTIEEVLERWDRFIAAMRTNDGYRYSIRNLRLIFNQSAATPAWSVIPTRLRAYNGWLQESRRVRRGEHAIRVLVPRTGYEVTEWDDDHMPAVEEERVRGFHLTCLFDISQTGPAEDEPAEPLNPSTERN